MDDTVTGELLIGGSGVRGTGGVLYGVDPLSDTRLGPGFGIAAPAQVDAACRLAEAAYQPFSRSPAALRAQLFDAIGVQLGVLGKALADRMGDETGMGRERIHAEQAALAEQCRQFARVLRAGHGPWEARGPGRRAVPAGPVAVFAGSHCSLACSVAGVDSMAALAAGCPVIAQTHHCYPGTSELLGRALQAAIGQLRLPPGTFALLVADAGGGSLAEHPLVRAASFACPSPDGWQLLQRARARSDQIVIHGPAWSANPAFVLPHALNSRAENIAQRYIQQLSDAAGQARQRSALLVALDTDGYIDLREGLAEAILNTAPAPLNLAAHAAYQRGAARCMSNQDVERIAEGREASGRWGAQALLFETDAGALARHSGLMNDVMGPVALLVRCADAQQMLDAAACLHGQLAAAVHMDEADQELGERVLGAVERSAASVMVNGYPGMADACSDQAAALAIERYLRPVCYAGAGASAAWVR